MRTSNSSYSLQRDFQRLQSKIEIMETRHQTGSKQSKSKLESVGYSQIDNKENCQIQVKSTKYSYGAKYKQKQELQNPQIEQIQEPKINDKKKLSVIFKFYASFGDRTNVDYLRSNKVHKMIADAQLRNHLDTKSIDLLYVKANRNKPNMDFENFYYFLELLCEQIFGSNTLDQLISDHLDPLYHNIITSTDLGDEEYKLSQPIDIVCVKLMQLLINPLLAIYNRYFPPHFRSFNIKESHENMQIKSQTKSQLFQFMKDFELCPQLITKGNACLLYDSILEDIELPQVTKPNIKQKLDLNQFCCYIIKLAMISFNDVDQNDQTQISPLQKLAYLLERMELSQGFVQLDVPNSFSKNWKLKVPEEIIEIILTDPNNAFQYLNNQPQPMKINQLKNEEFHDDTIKRINTVPSKQQQLSRHQNSIQSNKQFESQSQQLFQEYYQELYNIYRQYAGINSQTGQENELTGSKWLKLLKDANLINNSCIEVNTNICIPHNEIDLIFAKACQCQQQSNLTRGSVQRRSLKQSMNFIQFMKALQFLGKDYRNLEIILKEYILKLMNRNGDNKIKDLLGTLMSVLKDKDIVELLGLLHKSIIIYYKFYAGNKGLMNFEQFQKFYKDFQIFPDLLTKNKIIAIFQILSKLFEQNGEQKNKSGIIDQHMFVESLALASLEIQYNDQLSQIEKICYLIERINQSEGPRIVQKQLGHTKCPSGQDWDLLYFIKKRFSWLFEQKDELSNY